MSVALITKGFIAPAVYNLVVTDSFQASLDGVGIACDTGEPPLIRIGNSIILDFRISVDGARLTQSQLAAAENILFSVKQDRQDDNDDSLILKEIGDGLTILPDMGEASPNVRVTLDRSDTLLEAGSYPTALQVDFTDEDVKEAILQFKESCFNEIYFAQDVIR